MKAIICHTTIQVVISTIVGSLWVIIYLLYSYLLYSQNIQVNLKLFFYSFLGGLPGGIVGVFIGYLVGLRKYKEPRGDLGKGIGWFFLILVFWIIGILEGAVLGGLIFIRFYS
ncbi:hypothetical protein [Dendronalium phyllosphericum]|nr:hypothetical protein [Dendronalium phyllosphericum]